MSFDYIGRLVKSFESGKKGSLSLGQCGNDWGLSCGSYQLTLRWGNCIAFLKKYWPTKAASLYFNSGKGDFAQPVWPGAEYCSSPDEVKKVWLECYEAEGDKGFFALEHEHIANNYYIPIKREVSCYMNLDNECRAIQEMFWSWSVHKGATGALRYFKDVLKENGIKDTEIKRYDREKLFDLCYDKRYVVNTTRRYQAELYNGDSEREVLRPYLTEPGMNCIEIIEVGKEREHMSLEIKQCIATQNPCYKAGRKNSQEGGMQHSVGCSQPDPKVFVRIWQQASAQECVHAVIGKEPIAYQLLPWDRKAWHCGSGPKGSGNNTLISVELTEPATIKYTGGANWIEVGDGSNTKAHVLATYRNAVEFWAWACKEFGFSPNDVISHHEGNVRGIASNHGDVEHIWNKFGLTMNQFRKDIQTRMKNGDISVTGKPVETDTSSQKVNAMHGHLTIIYAKADGINVRRTPSFGENVVKVVFLGAEFDIVGISADEKWYKTSDGYYITTIPDYVKFKATEEQKESTAGTGYYRVRKSWKNEKSQIGAFKQRDNAIALCRANAGYCVYDQSGKQIYPVVAAASTVPYKVRVDIEDLRIRKGPGTTYDYHKENGRAKYTGKGLFTIVKEKEGPGAAKWGLLKAYADSESGWISLDFATKLRE